MPLSPELLDLAKRVNNWGRWGDDDEIGTLNLITPERVRRAATCVRTGKRFLLALPLSPDGPQIGAIPGRVNPLRTMTQINSPLPGDDSGLAWSDDVVVMGLQAATHWDALSHVSFEGRLYNGFPASSVDHLGAARCSSDRAGALVARAVLLDVARARRVERLEGGTALTAADLDAAEDLARARVEPGDIVLVRTGQMQLLHAGKKGKYAAPAPGPSVHTVEWFRERDVAAVATDTITSEVFPSGVEGAMLPVHWLHLVEMGLTQGQNWDLEALAADCADDGVYEMFLDATPQPFARAVGSPVAPVAVK